MLKVHNARELERAQHHENAVPTPQRRVRLGGDSWQAVCGDGGEKGHARSVMETRFRVRGNDSEGQR